MLNPDTTDTPIMDLLTTFMDLMDILMDPTDTVLMDRGLLDILLEPLSLTEVSKVLANKSALCLTAVITS